MSLPEVNSYEIKVSRNNYKVPIVNDIHLHSIYNPIKESENFVSTFDELLRNKNNILVLGLGFGYHILQIEKNLKKYHGKNFKITVIEPCKNIVQDCQTLKLINSKNINIYCAEEVDEIYKDSTLINFLVNRPGIIAHPPSFNLYKSYFTEILSYKASDQMKDICSLIKNSTLRDGLSIFNKNETLSDSIDKIETKKIDSELDFLLLAFKSISRSNQGTNING